MDTEYEFSPWDLCKAHILMSTPEKTAKKRLRHKNVSTKGAAPTKSVINLGDCYMVIPDVPHKFRDTF